MLRVGRNCKWEDIEVGEVFAFNGCWTVLEKTGKDSVFVLATDTYATIDNQTIDVTGMEDILIFTGNLKSCGMLNAPEALVGSFESGLYKLPKSIQRLWKEE